MKKAGIITLISGAAATAAGIVLPICSTIISFLRRPAEMGVIGGADGPTAVFVTSTAFNGTPSVLLILGFLAIAAGAILLIAAKKK